MKTNFFLKKNNSMLLIFVLFYLFTRCYHLTLLPIFNDEAIYLYWAELIAKTHAHLFISLTDGKPPIFIWLLALSLHIFPQSMYLFAGRIISVGAGMITLFGIYAVASFLFQSRNIALWSVFLYIICPFSLFYDRLALFDSFLSAMLIWAVYFTVKTAQSLKKRDAIFWGCCMGMAFLIKANALLFLFLLPILFLISIPKELLITRWKRILLLLGIFFFISQILRYSLAISHGYHEYTQKSVPRYSIPLTTLIENPFMLFPQNTVHYLSWFASFITLPMFLLGIIGGVFAIKARNKIGSILVSLWVIPIIATASVSIVSYPRYILYTLPYFLILSGYIYAKSKNKIVQFLLLLFLAYPLLFDRMILYQPSTAPLPDIERSQYISGVASGYGLQQAFTFLERASKKQPITVVTLGTVSLFPYAFNLTFWNNPNVEIVAQWPVTKTTQRDITTLARKRKVYVVLKYNSYQDHKNFLKELGLQKVLQINKPGNQHIILIAIPKNIL